MSNAALSSSCEQERVSGGRSHAGPMMPPERLSLMWSTPFLICSRIAFTNPYGPSHSSAWPEVRKWPPVVVRKWPAGEQARADEVAAVEGALPRDVHVVVAAGAAQADDARLGQRRSQPIAEQRHLVGERHLREREVVGMDVHVPQAGQEMVAVQVDHFGVRRVEARRGGSDRADPAVFDEHVRGRANLGRDAVDQRRVGEQGAHEGPRPIRRRCRRGRRATSTCRPRRG